MASVCTRTVHWGRIAALLLLFHVLAAGRSWGAEDLSELVQSVKPAFGTVIVTDAEGKPYAQGSGFFLSEDGLFVTNYHVIANSYGASVHTADGQVYRVRGLAAKDQDGDVVILSVEVPTGAKVASLRLADSLPREGQRVMVAGTPKGLDFTVSDGIVASIRHVPSKAGLVIQFTAAISHGSSGGPVVDMEGRVLGVATFCLVDGQNLNFAMPSSRIAALHPGDPVSLATEAEEAIGKTFDAALVLQQSGKYDQSLPLLKEVIEAKPNHAEAWFYLGRALAAKGEHKQAVKAYSHYLGLGPSANDASSAWNNLGFSAEQLGDKAKAQAAYRESVRQNPQNARAWRHLGSVAFDREDWRTSIIAYRRAADLDPSDESARANLSGAINNLGREYLSRKQYRAAVELFRQALQVNPANGTARRNAAAGCNAEAVDLMRAGNLQAAAAELRDAIQTDPGYALAYFNLGLIALDWRDTTGAWTCYGHLLALDVNLANQLRSRM